MDKTKFEEFKKKYWPKTKKEFERGMDQTKKALKEGEKHLKVFSEHSARHAKRISLSLKREKMYYELGKRISSTPKTKWNTTDSISNSVRTIKDLGQEIKKLAKAPKKTKQ